VKVAYHAANPIDAQMVLDLLADAEIGAHLQGAFLIGGIGELPAGEILRVGVSDEDLDRARKLIGDSPPLPAGDEPFLPASPMLVRSWQRAWSALGGHGDALALRQRLLAAWSEPQRQYHTLQHLQECIALLEPQLALAEHPGDVELALWFHDAVYDVRGRDNESRSADWAGQELQRAGVPAAAIARVRQLIMATCHDALPRGADAQLLVDVDLSILGAPPARFAEYELQVRQEYAWVPGPVFRRKRRALLAQFLARPRIYGTEHFNRTLESPARDNLRRSLARLRPWYLFWQAPDH
jgi:predicted metal-dependent HD superfamily phosphohydrolase